MTNERERPDDAKDDGVGPDGTIPDTEKGLAAGYSDEHSNFEPEEDQGEGDEPN